MKAGVIYSDIPGKNGADYVADFLCNGFKAIDVEPIPCGKDGQYPKADFYIHSSGAGLRPGLIHRLRGTGPVLLWTFTDELRSWKDRIEPITKLVDIHFSYTKAHPWGDHVRYLPLAADPEYFFPSPKGYNESGRDIDVSMIGARRAYRSEFCDAMEREFEKTLFAFTMGLTFPRLRDIHQRSKVVIAPVQDCDNNIPGSAWGCPCRTFEVPATMTYQVHVSRGGLNGVYPFAVSLPVLADTKANIGAWVDFIHGALDMPKMRRVQAEMDYEYTMANHLYEHRAAVIVEAVNRL